MADHFDRLLSAAPRTRLRPRLPGPFERVESLPVPVGTEPDPLAPPSPAPATAPPAEVRRVEREVRSHERITFVRTEHPPPDPVRPAQPVLQGEVPEPAASPPPPPRVPAPERTTIVVPQRDRPVAPERPRPVGVLRVAAAPVPSDQPRTRVVTAARAAAAAPRARAPQPAPPEVRVEIGRLEVTSARPPEPARPAAPQRREPAVNLADYLSERANP
ncbi:hypothetical protein [Saccharopolyspora flava]|uniref:Uncharacterized protein n=1 Tax=Saccharopolyspora flava TaxID=95161 RepID=A0A1I6U539_9PSEU|nr:hypothetical protein [Saccharopolyspora flava]SFS96566.1 hypothetical protein SAMN05660874_04600 [Saccharopolyspora flava]